MFSLLLSVLTLTIQVEEVVEASPAPIVWVEGSSEPSLFHESKIADRMSTMTDLLSSFVQKDEYTTSLEVENGMLTSENFALKTCLTHMIALVRSTDESAANAAFLSMLMFSCLLSFVCCTRYHNKASTPIVVSAEPIVVASDVKKTEP